MKRLCLIFLVMWPGPVLPLSAVGAEKPKEERKKEENGMSEYEVEFTYDGSRYSETVKAQSSNDANKLVKKKYPGCSIWNTKKK